MGVCYLPATNNVNKVRAREVSEYTDKFHCLTLMNIIMEFEEQLITRFFGGLKHSIQMKITLQPSYSLMNAINIVGQIQRQADQYLTFTPGVSTSKSLATDIGILPMPKDKAIVTEPECVKRYDISPIIIQREI